MFRVSPVGPIVYPVTKAIALAKAPPSFQRNLGAGAAGLTFVEAMRRAAENERRLEALRAAEQIQTHR